MNLSEHTLRIAVLQIRKNQISMECDAARAEAQQPYALARLAGIAQLRPLLPGGGDAGSVSIKKGQTVVTWDEPKLFRVVEESTPEHIEDYVDPAALRDKRVLDLLRKELPELTGRRVTAARRAELEAEVIPTRGILASLATGEKVKVATVETHDPTGEFAYTPGKPGTAAILAALRAGTIREDGTIAPAQEPAVAAEAGGSGA